MKKHKKRAALQYVALVYFSFLALTLGTLRCAQKTRQALYGGQPAMAQITAKSEFSRDYQVSLGGGEWIWNLKFPEKSPADHLSQILPPCLPKWTLFLFSTIRNAIC